MSFCTQCGKELRPGARFCHSCGAPVPSGDTPPASPTPPVNQIPLVNQIPPANPTPPTGGGSKTPYVVVAVIAAIVAVAAVLALVLPRLSGDGPAAETVSPETDSLETGSPATETLETEAPATEAPETEPPATEVPETAAPTPAFRTEDMAVKVLRDILNRSDVQDTDYTDPLAAMGDFNGDSTQELLVIYETGSDFVYAVQYELWRLDESAGPICLDGGELFTEVGGDNGRIGLVTRPGQTYLAKLYSSPTGSSTSDYYTYWAWGEDSPSPDYDHPVTLESHSEFDDPDDATYSYSYMGEAVSQADFEARQNSLGNWTISLNPYDGPGGGVKTFDELLSSLE